MVSEFPFNLTGRLSSCPGIMGQEEYFQSAVLVPLIKKGNDWEILFQIRASGIRQGDEICFPGGGYDPGTDTSFEETVLRECFEELGIKRDKIRMIGPMDTLITPTGILVKPYIGILDISGIDELTVNPDEVAGLFTIPLSRLKVMSPQSYFVKTEMHPSTIDPVSGEEEIHLPAKALNLPERYHKSWGNRRHKIVTYKVEQGIIWGITAKILKNFMGLLI